VAGDDGRAGVAVDIPKFLQIPGSFRHAGGGIEARVTTV
jgi:hypothetical protein